MTDELINLLREIRPSFSDVGSRDVDTRHKQNQIDRAIELLSASKPAAPEGWKLVPIEPTEEMLEESRGFLPVGARHHGAEVYRAMLAISPAAPAHTVSENCPCCGCRVDVPAQSGEPCKNNNPATQKIIERWIKDERLAQSAEPVYQIEQSNGSWLDVSKVAYQSTEDYRRRIVYAAPQSSQPVEAGEPVAWQVHPFDYGVGSDGVYARTDRPDQVEAWKRKGWRVTSLYAAPQPAQTAQSGESAHEKALDALKVADRFCDSLTSEVCPDDVAIPIKDALLALTLAAASPQPGNT